MKRIVALSLATMALALALGVAAGAESSLRIIKLKPDARIDYRGITCATKAASLDVLICYNALGHYQVTIGNKSVAIARSAGGKVLFRAPGKSALLATPSAARGGVITLHKGAQIDFRGIQCITREANYNLLACVSATSPYAVSVSRTSVVVTRDKDGMVLFISQ